MRQAGRHRLDTLIINHGRRFGIPSLLAKLSVDCPKRQSVSAYDLCGVHAPELSELFLEKTKWGVSDGIERRGSDPPPTSADLLAERIARLILDAREAGLSDE